MNLQIILDDDCLMVTWPVPGPSSCPAKQTHSIIIELARIFRMSGLTVPTTPAAKRPHLSQLAGLHLWSLDPESGFPCPTVSQAGCRRVCILDSLFAQLPLIQTGYPSTLTNDKWALFDSSRAQLTFRHGFCGVRIGTIRSEGIVINSIASLPGYVLVQALASHTT